MVVKETNSRHLGLSEITNIHNDHHEAELLVRTADTLDRLMAGINAVD